jgi:MTH538 TIR-like domain (DUF1863)
MVLYDGFISYSQAEDKQVAAALPRAVQKLGKLWHKRRALRLFRDGTSLSATPHLWPTIEWALSQSRFFILLASSEGPSRKWVNREVTYWIGHKSIDMLLIGLTRGDLLGKFCNFTRSQLPPEEPIGDTVRMRPSAYSR